MPCPLEAVDRRLDDLHRQWHLAEDSYFDPDAFRVAIQTAIQTARTVSFILQSNKAKIPLFDEWYAPWRERFRADPLMRWMVDARNKIEKQGDLEAHSYIRVELLASHLDEGPTIEVPANLFDAPWKLVKSIPKSDLGDHIRADGTLRIERKWIENSLPDWELLDAVSTAYGRLAELVAAAHVALGLAMPETIDEKTGISYDATYREGRVPCMVGHSDRRSQLFSLNDGRPLRLLKTVVKVDKEKAAQLDAHYGVDMKNEFPQKGSTPEEFSAQMFKAAKKVFLKDGYHIHLEIYLRHGKPIHFVESRIDEPGQKYLLSRQMAEQIKLTGADAVVLIDEMWMAKFDPQNRYRRAANAPDRREVLSVTLARAVGEPMRWSAEILRNGSEISFGQDRVEEGGALFIFAPAYQAWGRQIPKEWIEAFGQDSSST